VGLLRLVGGVFMINDTYTVGVTVFAPSFLTDTTTSSAFFFSPPWHDGYDIDEVKKEMKLLQGFREKNLFWYNHLKTEEARKMSIMCLKANREEQVKRFPKIAEEHKAILKPRSGSVRKWMTGKPRR
jgi:hypothetical protein